MKLLELEASRYRSLREETVVFQDLNVFIGANASGKSAILDALRFLHEGLAARDFREAVNSRGRMIHLAWKGENADRIALKAKFQDGEDRYEWSVELDRKPYDFSIREEVLLWHLNEPPAQLLSANEGSGWWYSTKAPTVRFRQPETTCGLSIASADEAFPARHIAEFISGWGFFDPNPFSLRHGGLVAESDRLDPYGRNLAERLYQLKESSPEIFKAVASATKSVLGLPTNLEPRESEGRYYFAQMEPGLVFPVHQIGASTGTLRILALITALVEGEESGIVAIEEPESNIHPAALEAFAGHLMDAKDKVQILITTHSPLILDYLSDPRSVFVVRRDEKLGTKVAPERNPEGVAAALEASGFSLGEFHQTKGFGG